MEKKVRLDKWLWIARFYKTRSLASTAISGGKVRLNNQRCKPSKIITIGDVLDLKIGYDATTFTIIMLADKRLPYSEAQKLYQETSQSILAREKNQQLRKIAMLQNPHPIKKPDKKERRQLRALKPTSDI